ncbi:hypothetical protein MKW98_011767 [Papaver atlanticum]|uniref:Uncharacterized protein n=1 Tax=Papaver atlanticum TaxID=357466 RepID=A0AAD4SNI0_9MAGN|nr:hypothetical protein MKW98_011767 [Papaver atlanticum]
MKERLVCAEYRIGVMELILGTGISKSGIRNEDLGFVFDRGKAARKSYDTDNIPCLLRFRISRAMGFVFDRGNGEMTTKICRVLEASHRS